MINVKELHLRRFCQFTSLDMNLSEGLIRIAGPNGSGKTTVFRALVYGLTGWCDPSWGVQSELQQDSSSVPGYVELVLDIEGRDYILTRYTLVTPKTPDRITMNSNIVAEKRQRVNAFLENFTSVSLPILAQLMWLRQEQSSWLLTATPASINAFLGSVFDTKHLEKLRVHLKNTTDKIATIYSDFEERQKTLDDELSKLPDKEQLEASLQSLKSDLRTVQDKLSKFDNLIVKSQYEDLKQTYEKLLEDIETRLTHNNELLSQCKLTAPYSEMKEQKVSLYKELQATEAKINNTDKALTDVNNKLSAMKECLDVLQEQTTRCSLCDTPLKDTDKYKIKLLLNTMKRLGLDIHTIDSSKLSEVELAFSTQMSVNISKSQELQETLDALTEAFETTTERYKTLEKDIEVYHQRERYLNLIDKENSAKEIAQAKLEALERMTVIEDTETSKEALEELESTLEANIKTIETLLSDYDSSTRYYDRMKEVLEDDRKQYRINTKAKLLLTTLRECLSQNRAQARYINSKIDTLNSLIAEFLRSSEMPFTLELDKEEHAFKYHMADSDVWHPAGMLSGAQKAAASIAIQLALLKVVTSDVTLLLVDEADAALDASNKFIAASLYTDIANDLSSNNGTVLIISQSDTITDMCDREIDLCTR